MSFFLLSEVAILPSNGLLRKSGVKKLLLYEKKAFANESKGLKKGFTYSWG